MRLKASTLGTDPSGFCIACAEHSTSDETDDDCLVEDSKGVAALRSASIPAATDSAQKPLDYHKGLDGSLPRWLGTDYYSTLSPAEMQQNFDELQRYTQQFDAENGTNLYDQMVRNGFPQK